MKYLIALLMSLSVIVTGCKNGGSAGSIFGPEPTPPPRTYPVTQEIIYQTDPAFQTLLERFMQLSSYYGRNPTASVAIIFGNTRINNSRTIGYCQIRSQQNLIVIDQNNWVNQDALTQESIIFHELGHCLLMRPHRQQYRVNDLTPISLMHPQVIKSWLYSQYYYNYHDELFSFIDYVPLLNSEKPLEYLTEEGNCVSAHD